MVELNPVPHGEHGTLTGIWDGPDGLSAVASAFPYLFWPARAAYEGHRLRYRVTVHRNGQRIGVFDHCEFPIQDLAFHPSLPLVAIATGAYDGGYEYEGNLWILDYQKKDAWKVFGENREVLRCHFLDAQRLAVTLSPKTEEETVVYEGIVEDWQQGRPSGPDPRVESFRPRDEQLPPSPSRERAKATNSERGTVWDLAFRGRELLVAHRKAAVEGWSPEGARNFRVEGSGLQLLWTGRQWWVHHQRGIPSCASPLLENTLGNTIYFAQPVTGSVDRYGRILWRWTYPDTSLGGDQLWPAEPMEERQNFRLGRYDCFNTFLRVDGKDVLYFLRGENPEDTRKKRLCWVEADGKVVTGPAWDSPTVHRMCSNACATEAGFFRSYYEHHPHPGKGRLMLDLYDPRSGEVWWEQRVNGLATALLKVPQRPWVLYALKFWKNRLFRREKGDIRWEETLEPDGLRSVPTALALDHQRLAIGTVEGRILLTELPL